MAFKSAAALSVFFGANQVMQCSRDFEYPLKIKFHFECVTKVGEV